MELVVIFMKIRAYRILAKAGHGVKIAAGMTIAIEPMVNAGDYNVAVLDDDWTVVTDDGSLSAHYENTVLITKRRV